MELNEIDNFIENCYKNKKISFSSFLIYLDDLNYDYLQNKYDFHYLDEGKNIENIIHQINMSNILNNFNLDKKQKILVIDGIAIYDKGFSTYMYNILKEEKEKNIPIFLEIYDLKDLSDILKNKCKIIKNKNKNNKPFDIRPKFKNISHYKKFLYTECQKNIYHLL